MKRNLWTEEQLTIALNLYWRIPYNKISGSSNLLIREYALIIGRTPAALAYKLMNFTSLDSERKARGKKGKSSSSKLDKIIWKRYLNQWEKLAGDSLNFISQLLNKPKEDIINLEKELKFIEGKEKEKLIKIRINQNDFRQRILASYNDKCCITGLDVSSLLVASHIIPWSKNKEERLNPKNGLCLNSIHDKAFDRGLLTITKSYKVQLSKVLLNKQKNITIKKLFLEYENQTIILPDRYLPNPQFLEWHYQNVFLK